MKLWLVPASDAPATANLPKTLSQPISNERKERASLVDSYQHAWGARSGVKNDVTLENLHPGDVCLFYTADSDRKKYNWAAEVAEVRNSSDLSQALWDSPEFKWVYFLRGVRRIDVPVERLSHAFAKYRENYFQQAPKGIVSVDPDVVDGIVRNHGSIENWLSLLENKFPELAEFLAVVRRYHTDRTVFQSSVQAARYAILAVDDRGCDVRRLDAEENARCTIALLAEKLDLVRRNDGRFVFDTSFCGTSAVRNCLLQSSSFALSVDRREILDVVYAENAVNLFCEILRNLRVDESSGTPKLYKPAMIACVLDAIEAGELPTNKISFEWVTPRFIAKMKELGEDVGAKEAAMPFYHLTGDLFWLLSYNDLEHLVSGGSEGPNAITAKVSHASLKDTFWAVLQKPEYRLRAKNALTEHWWPVTVLKRSHHSYWIFQANPEKFDIDSYVRGRTDIRWSVRQHKDAIHIGDVVLMWKSGSNSGVVAECIVTSEPSEQIGEDAPELWHVDPAADKDLVRCKLRVKEAFPDKPISRESIAAAVPGLGIFKFSQGTNFPLSEREYEAITELRDVAPLDKSHVRYWKVAPGKNASYWPECRDGGFIAIGWEELGDMSQLTREEYEERRDKLCKSLGWNPLGVDQTWKFRQIRVSDRIIANNGTAAVLGVGTVTGPYFFAQDQPYPHRLPVRWDDLRERSVDEYGWRKTLIEISRAKFLQITGTPVITIKQEPPPVEHLKNPDYSLLECSNDTGFDLETLERWLRGLERKGQAIFYGPPGTGKTFIAEKLAKHLVGGTDGIQELVQFHPAYSYEDFMQGIRPQTAQDGSLAYPMSPGRFMEFCVKASQREVPCVLIVDEINRADLSRVFGELMYLLEYRDREIPLAGGGLFQIPKNVRLIGTMNTADRSIALVDHALRRRFTFIPLTPQYEILRNFQQGKGFDATRLIQQLKVINNSIGDPYYEVGITFFLRNDLEAELPDIWRMEIEPYLEELFFDQRPKFEQFRWEALRAEILP